MSFTSLVPGLARPVLAVALITIGAGAAWQVQSWRYGAQLAEQARLHLQTLNQLVQASVTAEQTQREQRFVLEQRLYDNDQSNQRALSNAKQNQARLRDRLYAIHKLHLPNSGLTVYCGISGVQLHGSRAS